MDQHSTQPTLVIGQYIDQLDELGEMLDAPVIKGETPVKERQRLFDAFRSGEISLLVVSKVANFSIDLPSAEVAIQVSGSFGSRQEEAQRLGRLLRPKAEGKTAHFYTIVSRDTVDADFAQNRQRFLAEQGYAYRIIDSDDLEAEARPGELRPVRRPHRRPDVPLGAEQRPARLRRTSRPPGRAVRPAPTSARWQRTAATFRSSHGSRRRAWPRRRAWCAGPSGPRWCR